MANEQTTNSSQRRSTSDGVGFTRYPQWYNGLAIYAPPLEPIDRSRSHTKVVDTGLATLIGEARKELLKSPVPQSEKEIELQKLNAGINAINKSTKEKPLTEFELIKLLKFRTPRKRHTPKLEKHIIKQMGRKRGKIKLAKLLTNGNSNKSEQESTQ